MNNYQLLIGPDRQEVDLDEKVGIALSKVYENLDDPTKMYATWSKTIQVPMTAKNNRIFDNMFRQDQAVTTTGIDPRKKIPFVLLHNQEHILTGYAKVNDIDNSQKTKKYNVTLYSVIADIINDLKLCTFDSKTAADPKYVLRNPLSEGCVVNRHLVKSCWEQTGHSLNVDGKTDLDWIGFMPSYQGKYPDFSSDKIEIYDGRVDPYFDDKYEGQEVDEHYLGELCVGRRPVPTPEGENRGNHGLQNGPRPKLVQHQEPLLEGCHNNLPQPFQQPGRDDCEP